ncbi:MAG: hypothetical protein IID44_31450, partial [Planctomycetes bacterium]|nr:hypothetical protein [Planctomycetota bacterium]
GDDAFRFSLNVVPGDVTGDGRVDRADLVDLIHALGDRTASADALRRDLDGDAQIDIDDLRAALLRAGSELPTGSPHPPGSATPQAAVDVVFERLGGAGANALATSASNSLASSDRPLRSETPAFRRRLGSSHRRGVSDGDEQLDRRSSRRSDRRVL